MVLEHQVARWVKNPPAMQETSETWIQSLGWEDHPEEGVATHASILAWRIPWREEPDRLQSMWPQGWIRLKWLRRQAHSTRQKFCGRWGPHVYLSCHRSREVIFWQGGGERQNESKNILMQPACIFVLHPDSIMVRSRDVSAVEALEAPKGSCG